MSARIVDMHHYTWLPEEISESRHYHVLLIQQNSLGKVFEEYLFINPLLLVSSHGYVSNKWLGLYSHMTMCRGS